MDRSARSRGKNKVLKTGCRASLFLSLFELICIGIFSLCCSKKANLFFYFSKNLFIGLVVFVSPHQRGKKKIPRARFHIRLEFFLCYIFLFPSFGCIIITITIYLYAKGYSRKKEEEKDDERLLEECWGYSRNDAEQ